MRKVKGLLVIVLSLLLVYTAPAFTALAESENYSAFYNGYRYDCYGHLGSTTLTVEMDYLNPSKVLSIDSTVTYSYDGETHQFPVFVSQKANLSYSTPPEHLDYLISMDSDFQISMHTVYSMLLYAN